MTRPVREALNTTLRRHECGDGFLSDHTFVFVRSLETLALQEIGRECKPAVQRWVCEEAPGIAAPRVFWNGHQFDVVMETESDYELAKRSLPKKAASALAKILAAADHGNYCQSYRASLELNSPAVNLFHLVREDFE